jgi:hypothetical protein
MAKQTDQEGCTHPYGCMSTKKSTKSELRLERYEGFTTRGLIIITGTRTGT